MPSKHVPSQNIPSQNIAQQSYGTYFCSRPEGEESLFFAVNPLFSALIRPHSFTSRFSDSWPARLGGSRIVPPSSSDPSRRVPEGSDVCCESGRSWQGAITMAKKKKKAAKKVAKKKKARK